MPLLTATQLAHSDYGEEKTLELSSMVYLHRLPTVKTKLKCGKNGLEGKSNVAIIIKHPCNISRTYRFTAAVFGSGSVYVDMPSSLNVNGRELCTRIRRVRRGSM